jgi:hypothetical protein
LSREQIALRLIGQAGYPVQTGESECQLEDRVVVWRAVQELAFYIIYRERPVMSARLLQDHLTTQLELHRFTTPAVRRPRSTGHILQKIGTPSAQPSQRTSPGTCLHPAARKSTSPCTAAATIHVNQKIRLRSVLLSTKRIEVAG